MKRKRNTITQNRIARDCRAAACNVGNDECQQWQDDPPYEWHQNSIIKGMTWSKEALSGLGTARAWSGRPKTKNMLAVTATNKSNPSRNGISYQCNEGCSQESKSCPPIGLEDHQQQKKNMTPDRGIAANICLPRLVTNKASMTFRRRDTMIDPFCKEWPSKVMFLWAMTGSQRQPSGCQTYAINMGDAWTIRNPQPFESSLWQRDGFFHITRTFSFFPFDKFSAAERKRRKQPARNDSTNAHRHIGPKTLQW